METSPSLTKNGLRRVAATVFDKTGTLTVGNPEVADVQTYSDDI